MNNKKHDALFIILPLSLLLVTQLNFAEDKRIMKWVDSKGVTHYGDKLPPKQAGKSTTQMRSNGIVITNKAKIKNKETAAQNKAHIAQQRQDNILLSSYTNAEEIDLARDRNLKMANATLQAITVQKENNTEKIERNNKAVESYRKRKKPLPAALSEDLEIASAKSKKLDAQIMQQKLNIEATKKRYAEENLRFITLKTEKPSI